MLTETEARDLLARAAETIDVAPGTPIEIGSSRRRWLLVPACAAAAAVLVTAGVALVGGQSPDGPAPSRVGPDSTAPAMTGIPSVFGWDADSAEQMLTRQGLTVTRKPSYTCETFGRAVRTEPAAGSSFTSGDSVTLFVTGPNPAGRCARPAQDTAAWTLLDFANDRGSAPSFASEVSVYVNGLASTLTGQQASDQGSWGPDTALGALAAATRQEGRRQGVVVTPRLQLHRDDGTVEYVCNGEHLPGDLADRPSLLLSVALPSGGAPEACTFANVFRTDHRIDALVLRTSLSPATIRTLLGAP